MDIDLTLTGIENLVAAINLENPLAEVYLTPAKIIAGLPVPHGGAKPGNTDLLLTAAPNSGLRNSRTFNYRRNSLTSFSTLGAAVLYVNQTPSFAEVIAEFKTLYGVDGAIHVTDDVMGSTIPLITDAGVAYTITAKSSSLLWVGNIVVTLRLKTVALEDIIFDTDLDGPYFPTP